ncbi:serine threonine kinase [Fusarium mexicanum]|uniref:Serine threonine kinase n=1 Tax=Fusarium mexicanum TaxID=751941 RepID=A0A8H5MJ58_9HYPO|nr:serine threonine kinase [Fusarium mexicanum]
MTTIRDCYIQCSGSFNRLIKRLGISTGDNNNRIPLKGIVNEYSRFDVWAGSVGAKHAPHKRISLDYRLRDSSFYAARVVDILQRLDITLSTASDLVVGERPLVEATQPRFGRQRDNDSDRSSVTSSAESSSSDEADMMTPERQIASLYESITKSVRHLYSLAMVIRQPVATDRLSRASKITVDHFISFDQRHVDECFPDSSLVLKKRLAKAITRRRQLLIYNEQHYRKSSEPQPSEETTVTGHIAQDEPREKAEQEMPPPPVTSDSIQHLVRDTPSYAPTISKGSLLASTEATKFIPPVDVREEPDVQSESGTITTFGFTGKDSVGIRVPPRPQDDNGEALEQFLCPLCYHLIEVKGERAWTRHVFRDLQAYVCTFDNCETPDILYETRQDWLRHEFENHRREWHCNDPEHKPFNIETEFIEHIKALHEPQLLGPQLLSLAKLCERSSSADTVPCPLCRDGCHDVVNGFECYKTSWIMRQVVDYTCPESFESAKLPERHFNKTADSILTKVTPWLVSLPKDFATDGNPAPDSTERPHHAHPTIGQRGPCLILSSDLKRHIGQHLERLALFALNRSKLMPDDGNSAHTDDAVARSETSYESLQSANSLKGNGHQGHGHDAANVASKMDVTLVDLATYEAWYHHEMLDDVHLKLEVTRRLIEETLIESAFTDQKARASTSRSHYLTRNSCLFSPEGSLEDIITMGSVLSAVCNTGETMNSIDPETFKYTIIYTEAIGKKLFSISVLSGLEGEGLWHAMDFFYRNNISDKNLPLEESYLRDLSKYLYELDSQDDTGASEVDDLRRKKSRNLWSSELIDNFCNQHQWKFCAAVFSTEETLELRHQHEKCILPFTEKCTDMDEDSYGQAIKYKIHQQHLVSNDMTQSLVYVTVTRLSFEPMWQDELGKLKRIQALNQRHIVKLITTFRQGEDDFYFVSEASDGGNLRDFWQTFPEALTAGFVRSVIEQLYGLVYASFEVSLTTALFERTAPVSNDNLSPENILWFKERSGAGHRIGTMKTCHQSGATQLVSGHSLSAKLYKQPGEGSGMWFRGVPSDDMWAMGCITLEFMIWLLYGCEGLNRFHQHMKSGSPEPDSNRHFWQSSPNGFRVHPVVIGWMGHIAKDPVCRVGETALGDLLEITRDRLLVVDVVPWPDPRPIDYEDHVSGTHKGLSYEQPVDNINLLQKPTDEPVPETDSDLWNKYRKLITKLYVQENKNIVEIQEIMETGHRLEASKRKYQRQLDKWLFEKGRLSLSRQAVEQPDARLWHSKSIKRNRARPKEVCDGMYRILSGAKSDNYWLPCPPLPPPDLSPDKTPLSQSQQDIDAPGLLSAPYPFNGRETKFPAHVNPAPSIFENGVYEILKRHNIDSGETTVELYMREQQGFPITALPTLFVISPWFEGLRGTWKSITEAITKSTSPDTGIQGEGCNKTWDLDPKW